MSFTDRAVAKMYSRKDSNGLVMTVESCDVVASDIVRVVGAFNRKPTSEECVASFEDVFDGKLTHIQDSFRVNKEYPKVVVSGFLKYSDVRPLSVLRKSECMKEVSSNVYMDNDDNSIWEIRGGKLVRNFDEDLTKLVSSVSCSPMTKGQPLEALASVKDFEGIDNTQYVAYVNPVSAEVSYGARVGDDHVYSAESGISEISQQLVIDCKELGGQDKVLSATDALPVGTDAQSLVDYYSQVYKYDPDYFVQLEDIIRKNAVA